MKILKKLRKEHNLSQLQMAEILKMSYRSYQNLEYGISEANYTTLIRIADFFGCSIDYLLEHQSQNILHKDSFSKTQQQAISLLKKLDDDKSLILLGYLARMTNTPIDDILSIQETEEFNS